MSAPPDRFVGYTHAVASYCTAVAERERVSEALAAAKPGSVEATRLLKGMTLLGNTITREGRQLRIHLSSKVDRKAGILSERSIGAVVDNENGHDDDSSLLGGRAFSARWD